MKSISDEDYLYLKKSYAKVGCLTWQNIDFIMSSLNISRNLFTNQSLTLRQPKPKQLEVYALLSGLPFSKELTEKLVEIQSRIINVIDSVLHYWVLPSNFGVEYCVFKWPDEIWNQSWLLPIDQALASLNNSSFLFTIRGVQINPDGCIVAKGYDENGMIFKIRKDLQSNLKFLPKTQSGWCHIPIGRILEPVGSTKFKKLASLINQISETAIISERINSVKFVHETCWYMEEKTILSEVFFD